MKANNNIPEFESPANEQSSGGVQLNIKRVVARALRFWYLIVLSVLAAATIAYIINRYSQRIYPIRASIIIKENDENVGAKFLYDNELINPYRNFYNELFIMKSYPLLQGVMEDLNFDVSVYREGEIKTTEYYDREFPVEFKMLSGNQYGKAFYFKVTGPGTFTLQHLNDPDGNSGMEFKDLRFNDSIRVNGFRLMVIRKGDIGGILNKIFTISFNDPLAMAKSYSAKLSAVWAQPGAAVVNLEVLGPVAQKEIDFLNKFIERYQLYDVEKKNKVATMAMRFLDEQLIVIGDSLRLFEDQVENFKRRNVITNLGEETTRLYTKLQGFEDQKFHYRLLDNYFKYITKLLKSDQYDGIFTPSSVGISDNIVANLVNQLIELQTQVNLYKSYITKGVERASDNPKLTEKLQQIQFIKNDILKTIENSRETQKINIAFINDQIKLVEAELSRIPGTERELVGIQRNYSLKENLYVFLLQKKTEAGLSKASTTSDIIVVNPPMASGPITPKVAQNYAIAGGAGLFLPLIIFIILELANSRIQSKEDIEAATTVPVIGGIGHNLTNDALVVYRKPRSAMAESFRAIRSNLNYFTGGKDHQVFLVTSSIPGEGKSFTTLNLATVFALAGKRTIIVGADLRKPKLFDDLGLENKVGLSQFLSGLAAADEIVQQTSIENLFFIAGGPMPPNPSELLIQSRMGEFLAQLRQEYDFVVIDTPPLSFVTDAFALSAYVDHSLFVVRQDFTPRAILQSLNEQYSTGKLSKVSIIFNDLRKSGLGYGYGQGYEYGYGYGYGYFTGAKKKDASGYYTD